MDSLTFKSCALIMQDQYGLFLQAKPEERVEVLGTLLGLGVYQIMEKIASDKAKCFGAKTRELKQGVEIHNSTILSFGNPGEELKTCSEELDTYEIKLQAKTAERDQSKLVLTHQQEALERRNKLLTAVNTLQTKKATAEQNRATQEAIINNSSIILDSRLEIEAKVLEYNSLMEKERVLAKESALYSSKKTEAADLRLQELTEQEAIQNLERQVSQKNLEVEALQPTDHDEVVRNNAAEYDQQKKLLDEAYEKERAYREVKQTLTTARYDRSAIVSKYEAVKKSMEQEEESLHKKAELLDNVECIDIENANCGFLADAVSAKKRLAEYPAMYEERKQAFNEQIKPYEEKNEALEKQLAAMVFDIGSVATISRRVSELKPYVSELEKLNQRESQIAVIRAQLDNLQSNILEAKKRLDTVKLKAAEVEQERDRYAQAFTEHGHVQQAIQTLSPWLEKEKLLPVAEERKNTAMNRLVELAEELSNIGLEIAEKQAEADKESLAVNDIGQVWALVNGLDTEVNAINSTVKELQMKAGALKQKVGQIDKLKKEIESLQEQQMEYAKETADYDILKTAFSQSGVPHQIIRSIIPQLTATSNSILGQMTGGKMGVEFRLERLQKNGKEKGSLDIYIEEYGKPALPYLSKSGGEKVKSSLSVILALAEIKSSSAGIQLGMLFIDEPPFLDGDGIQAYCDALETIQNRYENIKIMAITHDPTMKARFPQNLDVVKTENGSKVIY